MNTLFISVYHSLSISGPKIVPLTIRKLVFLPADHCSVLLSALLQFQHGGGHWVTHFTFESHSTSGVIGLWCFFQPWHWENPGFPIFFPFKIGNFIQNRPLKSMKRFRWNPPGTPSLPLCAFSRAPCQVGAQLRASSAKKEILWATALSHSIAPQKWMVVDA